MQIQVSSAASEFLATITDTVYISLFGGWDHVIFVPAVFVGAPADPDNYEKHQADKLTVYLPKEGIYRSDLVTIDFSLVEGANRLQVRGLLTIPSITCQYQNPPTSKARRLLTEI